MRLSTKGPFGDWMQARRADLDLSQAELGRRVGCAAITIRKYESGAVRPSRQAAELLARVLEVPPADRARFVALARGMSARERFDSLPSPATSLIGRERDVSALADRLRQRYTRLINLIGPPGVGKTRLAIACAQAVRDDFEDGVCFVGLAVVSEADEVVPLIARTLGLRRAHDEDAAAVVAHFLRDREVLLVLDNFEHVLEAAPAVADLLTQAPRVKILATSRAVLRLSSEHEYEVQPLPVTGPNGDDHARAPAVALFTDRAHAFKPSFRLDAHNAPAVVEICRRLDGLPLAIELCAVRTRGFTPHTLLERLSARADARLDLLTLGQRDAAPHQHTLRETIAWSVQLLTPTERQLFGRASVFAGGFTLEAAQAVCGDDIARAADDLQSLVDHSLLNMTEATSGESRYGMLETVREYAAEQLAASGEGDAARRAHARYYTAMAWPDTSATTWPERATTLLRWIAGEEANLRVALSNSRDYADEPALHLRLASSIAWLVHVGGFFLGVRGDPAAIRAELEWSLARYPQAAPLDRSQASQDLAFLGMRLGEFERACRMADEGVRALEGEGMPNAMASAAHVAGWAYYAAGRYREAEAWFARQKSEVVQTGRRAWTFNSDNLIGRIAMDLGEYDRAKHTLDAALRAAREQGMVNSIAGGEATVLRDLGLLAYEQSDWAGALNHLQVALRMLEAGGSDDLYVIISTRAHIGRAALAAGDLNLARRSLCAALRGAHDERQAWTEWFTLLQLARLAAARGDFAHQARWMGALEGRAPLGVGNRSNRVQMSIESSVQAVADAKARCAHDPKYAAAWAAGAACALADAVREALDHCELE